MHLAYEALSRAHTADQPCFAQRLRRQLVRGSIHSIGAQTPWELLVAAFMAGVLTYRQMAHWLEFKPSAVRADVLGALAPHLLAELLVEALSVAQTIGDSDARARALGALAPQLSGNLLQQGFEELLDVLPRCGRDVSLYAVSSFFPFLEESQGPKGLEEVRCAIIDTTHWFP